MLKVFSTPADPSQAIVEALRRIAEETTAHDGELVLLHGTTVGTNTLLQRKGARSALVTTADFEDASKSDAKPGPSFTTSSSTASNRWFPKISASASTNAPPATAKS